ncbi:preprotein translocase subunit YajC [Psychrosphaera sp. B3R10]|uniref:Sec translocon accessory complex subunit YajC n=1 Tax=Psychrosphaera algicola TaxID=3023714 RepID=A0ABT5FHC3_9GAMM|nr:MULTISPECIES: preprotein translocase subunit YajC [unclassified Psychrosphaera]MBU2882942.1 preprotein translocase subunit YajC [Psychrosphaera sp. I2R16]MBU2991339.1 preprotein translocase subunit YajC [Psychrosphaera sp. B3R10]MDC2890581.1 preprotein translocase subunit YajC [Psychrosphaera sp. G1-22]MDO6720228.1 preprotein translocase subunit YajC [Psychrosphaera sp. 1_MG-2023]
MSLFISNAYAEGGAPAAAAGPDMLIMLLIFGVIFYFMIYRPQAKRVKEHKNLVSSLAKGDEVLTAGGMIGKITKVADDKDFVRVELAEGIEVMVQKGSINSVLPKGTIKSI